MVADRAEEIGRKFTEDELVNAPTDLEHEFQRLRASQEDTLKNTLKALTSAQAGKRRRVRGERRRPAGAR